MKYIMWIHLLLVIGNAYALTPVTNPSASDGFGSQFQDIIASMCFAEYRNKPWIYSPFQSMEHNYDNSPDFLEKKEQFVNIIGNYEVNTKKNKSKKSYKKFFDVNVARCATMNALKKLKKVFRANKDINNYWHNEKFNIAVHVRRPNVHDSRKDGTDTPDDLFIKIINKLRALYSEKNPQFHIYSQGSLENFQDYQALDVTFHLNESLEDTFLGMVLADALVSSASSFSYTAALLSEGIVYYMPFWHKPLPHWIPIA